MSEENKYKLKYLVSNAEVLKRVECLMLYIFDAKEMPKEKIFIRKIPNFVLHWVLMYG